jgi:protein-S-isoprenylcysteine O-methyltransferase Ste14
VIAGSRRLLKMIFNFAMPVRREEERPVNWIPLIGVVLFVGLGVCWRSWLQRRRYGSSGIVLFRSRDLAQNVREAGILVLVPLLVAEAIACAVAPGFLERFRIAPSTPVMQGLGAIVLFAGVALMIVAQLELGASWRIGIEENARPGLVARGLYRFCRNPIFLAMLAVLLGFALLVPTWPSVVALLGTYVGIRGAIGAEERYLLRAYGGHYAAYAARVGRFVPHVGRLAVR